MTLNLTLVPSNSVKPAPKSAPAMHRYATNSPSPSPGYTYKLHYKIVYTYWAHKKTSYKCINIYVTHTHPPPHTHTHTCLIKTTANYIISASNASYSKYLSSKHIQVKILIEYRWNHRCNTYENIDRNIDAYMDGISIEKLIEISIEISMDITINDNEDN